MSKAGDYVFVWFMECSTKNKCSKDGKCPMSKKYIGIGDLDFKECGNIHEEIQRILSDLYSGEKE